MANTAPTCNWGDRQPLDFQRYHRALVLCWECWECSECEAENYFCPRWAMEVGPWGANFRERQRRLQRSPSKATPQSTKRCPKAQSDAPKHKAMPQSGSGRSPKKFLEANNIQRQTRLHSRECPATTVITLYHFHSAQRRSPVQQPVLRPVLGRHCVTSPSSSTPGPEGHGLHKSKKTEENARVAELSQPPPTHAVGFLLVSCPVWRWLPPLLFERTRAGRTGIIRFPRPVPPSCCGASSH